MKRPTFTYILRWATWLCSGGLFVLAVWVAPFAVNDGVGLLRAFWALALFIWAVALYKQNPSALEFTSTMCVLGAIFLPIAIFNPFAALDGAEKIVSIPVFLLAETVIMGFAYLFNRPKESK